MKGRESKGPPSADLLVCFPTRAHLTLMPKPICSPARPSDPNKRHHNNHHHHHHHQHQQPHLHHNHHLRKLSTRGGGGGGHGSPLLWSKTKPVGPDISEPTSPKVTCAGQIKVRPKASCKNWQSVMEEIEKLHNNRTQKKRTTWVEALGLKKDTMQFLTCLRRIRFDFRCFSSFPTTDLTSDDDDEEDDDDDQENREKQAGGVEGSEGNENSATVFSKWFMVLQQEKNNSFTNQQRKQSQQSEKYSRKEEPIVASCGPPPNALLLMRCRSAPAKSWLEEGEYENDEGVERENEEEEEEKANLGMGEEKRSRSLAVVMKCDTDFYNFSSDIAKETWVVGGLRDPISRSRSWKR